MKSWKWIVAIMLCVVFAGQAEARGRIFGRRSSGGGGGSSYAAAPAGSSTATAQGVANIMARLGRVGHFGGNKGYEGCGSGGSAAAAYGNCCYANSGMRTTDVGYAQASNGQWYCCRRYN